jgi:hypothetical protein
MAECGLIEQGYYEASKAKGFTALRKPDGYGITIDGPEPWGGIDTWGVEPF